MTHRRPQSWAVKLALAALAILVLASFLLLSRGKAASEQVPTPSNVAFDHPNCQYPNRNTNPPNGCDNSDPACPETIKLGYDCYPPGEAPAVEGTPDIPVSQNTETGDKPVETVHKCQ